MSKKNTNPYNERSNYGKLFAFWKKKQVVTRSQLMEEGKRLKMEESAANASVTVVISPRKSDEVCLGDCRGNYSARGHLYYADKLKSKKNEEQRFRLRYRTTPMKQRIRQPKEEVKAVKTKTSAKAKTTSTTSPVSADNVKA